MKKGRAHHWLTKSSLRLGVAASLLLHLLFGVWLVITVVKQPAPQPRPRPDEIWFDSSEPLPPPPAPEVTKETRAPEPKKAAPKAAVKLPDQRTPRIGSAEAIVSAEPRNDQPKQDSPRAPVQLFPSDLPLSSRGEIPVEPQRGETIHPDDPRFDKDVIAAKEKARVTARVQGFAEDVIAEARAEGGLPHPYLVTLGESARTGLTKLAAEKGVRASPELAGKVLGARVQSAVESYGKGGDPNLGKPGREPLLSEKFTQPDQNAMRALAQSTEFWDQLTHGKPLLTLTLELRQTKDNGVKTTILKASVDPAFDKFVLEAWPLSIAKAGPPPPDAFHSNELRSIWEIEGWPGKTSFDKAMTYLPETGLMGVPLTKLIPGATKGFSYEFRARLLRVY